MSLRDRTTYTSRDNLKRAIKNAGLQGLPYEIEEKRCALSGITYEPVFRPENSDQVAFLEGSKFRWELR